MPRRLTLPETLLVAVIGTASIGCGDDYEDEPQECTIEGICPEDGRLCLAEDTGAPCCPICPVTPNECPSGCVLEFPPV